MSFTSKNHHHAQRIIAPILAARLRQSRRIECSLFFEVLRVDDDLAIIARRDAGQGGEINRRGHHKSFRIIRVLTNQIHSPRSSEDLRFTLETAHMQRTQYFRVTHYSVSRSHMNSRSTSIGQLKHSPGSSARDQSTR